jgi:ABC-type uncharacterized transport system involved in gliding motility auxiliary subunit
MITMMMITMIILIFTLDSALQTSPAMCSMLQHKWQLSSHITQVLYHVMPHKQSFTQCRSKGNVAGTAT